MDEVSTSARSALTTLSTRAVCASTIPMSTTAARFWHIRLALLTGGRIVQQGTQEEFLASQNPKVQEFLERDFPDATFAA